MPARSPRPALAALLSLAVSLPAACGRKSVDPLEVSTAAAPCAASALPPSASAAPPPSADSSPRPPIRLETVDGARCADFSPDRRVVVAVAHSTVVLLDRATFVERARVRVGYPVGPLAFSGDGARFAVASGYEAVVTLHDAATGQVVGPAFSERWIIRAVALSPDGSRLAVGLGGGEVVLWDTATGARIAESKSRGGMVLSLTFSPDGRSLHAVDEVLEVPSLHRRFSVTHSPPGGAFSSVAWLRGGSRLVVSCEDTKVCVYDATDGRLLRVLLGAHPFAVAADDSAVVYVKNGEVVFQDVETAAVMRRVPARGFWPGKLFALSADDRRITVLGFQSDDPIAEWDVEAARWTRSYAGLPASLQMP